MSRKNTILAAILVNTIFLVVLFSLTIKSNSEEQLNYPNVAALKESRPPVEVEEPNFQIETQKPLFSDKQAFLKEMEKQEIEAKPEPKPVEKLETPKPAPKVQEEFVMVTVKKGDVLAKIAKANGVTVKEIMNANNLKSTVLRIGQKLKIPKIKMHTVKEEELEFYTIRPGDNLWIIASKHQLKLSELKKLNQLDDEKAKRLKPGDQIRIR